MFANPGSTEVPFLAGLPDDIRFVLGLHETAVVGLASGLAIGSGRPALVLLHTTAGLGTGVSALATARVNRAPLVVVVGQQDRRHLAYEPFLAGKLAGLGGEYPVSVDQPARAQDVPAAVERAFHAAETKRGPALVIVPMDDWGEPADEEREPAAAFGPVLRAAAVDPEAVDALASFLAEAKSPALVVGAGADDAETWAALVELAERLVAPVFQESFGGRAGFPQDHRLYCGVLPAERARLRERLEPYDAILVVGAPAFRQAPYVPGRFTAPGTRIAVLGDDPDELHRSPAELAVLASPAAVCRELAGRVPVRDAEAPEPFRPAASAVAARAGRGTLREPRARGAGRSGCRARQSSSRRRRSTGRRSMPGCPAREPLGYLSAAQGGLGFAMPAAAGVRMALPRRPVVAVVGDGSAIYGVPVVWSAAYYGIGALFVVLSNERYAVMDRLVERHGGTGPWPAFAEVELATIARGFGCRAERITTHDELISSLDDVVPTLDRARRAARAGRPRRTDARLRPVVLARGGRDRERFTRSFTIRRSTA